VVRAFTPPVLNSRHNRRSVNVDQIGSEAKLVGGGQDLQYLGPLSSRSQITAEMRAKGTHTTQKTEVKGCIPGKKTPKPLPNCSAVAEKY